MVSSVFIVRDSREFSVGGFKVHCLYVILLLGRGGVSGVGFIMLPGTTP